MATLAKISWLKHSHWGNLPFLYHKLFKCRHVYRTTTATNTHSTPGIYICCSLQQLQAEGTGWQDVHTHSTQLQAEDTSTARHYGVHTRLLHTASSASGWWQKIWSHLGCMWVATVIGWRDFPPLPHLLSMFPQIIQKITFWQILQDQSQGFLCSAASHHVDNVGASTHGDLLHGGNLLQKVALQFSRCIRCCNQHRNSMITVKFSVPTHMYIHACTHVTYTEILFYIQMFGVLETSTTIWNSCDQSPEPMSDSLFEVHLPTILHMYVQVVSKPIGPTVTRVLQLHC